MHSAQVPREEWYAHPSDFGSTVAFPWSSYVMQAKHGPNFIFIFDIGHLKNR